MICHKTKSIIYFLACCIKLVCYTHFIYFLVTLYHWLFIYSLAYSIKLVCLFFIYFHATSMQLYCHFASCYSFTSTEPLMLSTLAIFATCHISIIQILLLFMSSINSMSVTWIFSEWFLFLNAYLLSVGVEEVHMMW